jgi:hypothetical protein
VWIEKSSQKYTSVFPRQWIVGLCDRSLVCPRLWQQEQPLRRSTKGLLVYHMQATTDAILLTQESFATDFDDSNEYDETKKDVNQRMIKQDVKLWGEETDGENGNNTSSSEDNAIAINKAC